MSEPASSFGSHPGVRAASAQRIPKMAQVVAAELRAKILQGEFKPGHSLLSEATLMEQYDVSRPTLREALRLLEAQDLISVRRGSHRRSACTRFSSAPASLASSVTISRCFAMPPCGSRHSKA